MSQCARTIDCLAYEFGQVGNYNLCELHKEVLAKTFPGKHGITCHVKVCATRLGRRAASPTPRPNSRLAAES